MRGAFSPAGRRAGTRCRDALVESAAPLPVTTSTPPPAARSPLAAVFLTVVIDLLGFGLILPLLPLYAQGYTSIGCEPCTSPPLDPDNLRSGRWQGKKLECGIHIQADQKS